MPNSYLGYMRWKWWFRGFLYLNKLIPYKSRGAKIGCQFYFGHSGPSNGVSPLKMTKYDQMIARWACSTIDETALRNFMNELVCTGLNWPIIMINQFIPMSIIVHNKTSLCARPTDKVNFDTCYFLNHSKRRGFRETWFKWDNLNFAGIQNIFFRKLLIASSRFFHV